MFYYVYISLSLRPTVSLSHCICVFLCLYLTVSEACCVFISLSRVLLYVYLTVSVTYCVCISRFVVCYCVYVLLCFTVSIISL